MGFLGLLLGALIGVSLGLLGGGGSILAVPVFVYVLGFDPKQAVAMSLAVVGIASLVGAVGYWRAGRVDFRIALVFGAIAMAGTYIGARLAVFFSGEAQLLFFAVVMLAAAYFMFTDRGLDNSEGAREKMPLALIAGEGLAVGVLTGLVGVGGGFLVVPALVMLGKVPVKRAVGTSLLVIAMKSASGLAGYASQVEIPWGFVLAFAAVAVVGSYLGSYLVRFISPGALKRGFSVFLIAVSLLILYENRDTLIGLVS